MNAATKEKLIRLAMAEAQAAAVEGNSPFGAVLADAYGDVIDVAHNTTNTAIDPTAHAEVNLIRKVAARLNTKDLSAYYLISNAESCPMCFSAAVKANISNFIFGNVGGVTMNPKIDVFEMSRHSQGKINIETGILQEECRMQIEKIRKLTL